MALGGVKSLAALREGYVSSQFGGDRSCIPLQVIDPARAIAHLRGLGALLLPSLGSSKPRSPTSCHSELSSAHDCHSCLSNGHSAAPHSHRRPTTSASADGLSVRTSREPAVAECSSPRSPEPVNCLTDSPLNTFEASHYPCSPSSESSFMSSYQDLNCTRVAAFADAAAAPSLLLACKNGAFSPSPPSSCLSSREPSPRGCLQWDDTSAFPVDASVCFLPLHVRCTQCAHSILK